MPRSTIKRFLVAATLAVLASSGAGRADEPCRSCNSPYDGSYTKQKESTRPEAPPGKVLVPPVPAPWKEYWRHPVGCWQHHSCEYGCSTLASESVFIFGSCRQFFGEPCLKGPPLSGDQNASCPPGWPACPKR